MSETLIKEAVRVRANAYAPYSGFQVGAAVLASDGRIFTGCNVENASYGLTNCAERTAIFCAVAAGCTSLEKIAVAADSEEPATPCGACRQVMAEFGIKQVILGNLKGDRREHTISELLPFAFQADFKRE